VLPARRIDGGLQVDHDRHAGRGRASIRQGKTAAPGTGWRRMLLQGITGLAAFSNLTALLLAQQTVTFETPVRLKAGADFVDTGKDIAHAGPQWFDLDADGKPDLVVGTFKGHFQIYKNVGTKDTPAFESKGYLQADGQDVKVPNW
jgi:hypothetical protein